MDLFLKKITVAAAAVLSNRTIARLSLNLLYQCAFFSLTPPLPCPVSSYRLRRRLPLAFPSPFPLRLLFLLIFRMLLVAAMVNAKTSRKSSE